MSRRFDLVEFISRHVCRSRRRRGSPHGPFFAALLAAATMSSVPSPGLAAADASVLRVCADPGNLPFTSSDPERKGIYLEFAEALAAALGRRFEAVWWDQLQGKRSVRYTLLAGNCDIYLGLPGDGEFMGRSLVFSKPLLEEGYALVAPKALEVRGLADLRGKRVAVLIASQPQILVATTEGVEASTFAFPEEAMEALAAGRVDVALIWGPSAGWLNKSKHADAYRVAPLAGERMQFPVGIAFRKQDAALRDQVDAKLAELQPVLDRLKDKYGFPAGTPVRLSEAAGAPEPARAALAPQPPGDAAAAPAVEPAPAADPVPAGTPTEKGTETALLDQGREVFASVCSHCHGPHAVTPEKRSNLRALKRKYAERMDEVFALTVAKGRPAKGMPAWAEVLSAEDIAAVKVYVDSVQGE